MGWTNYEVTAPITIHSFDPTTGAGRRGRPRARLAGPQGLGPAAPRPSVRRPLQLRPRLPGARAAAAPDQHERRPEPRHGDGLRAAAERAPARHDLRPQVPARGDHARLDALQLQGVEAGHARAGRLAADRRPARLGRRDRAAPRLDPADGASGGRDVRQRVDHPARLGPDAAAASSPPPPPPAAAGRHDAARDDDRLRPVRRSRRRGAASFAFSSTESPVHLPVRARRRGVRGLHLAEAYTALADGAAHLPGARDATRPATSTRRPPSRTWTVDTAAPNTTIDSGPVRHDARRRARRFAFSATETRPSSARSTAARSPPARRRRPTRASRRARTRSRCARPTPPATSTRRPRSRTWTVDTTAPDTTITRGPTGPTALDQRDLHVHARPRPARRSSARSTPARFAACTSPKAYTGLADGAHTFHVRATDAAGNADATPATQTWTVDTTAPDTTITAARPAPTSSTTRDVHVHRRPRPARRSSARSTAPPSPPARRRRPTPASPTARTPSRCARSTRPATPTPTPASRTWTVDTTAPDTTITGQPAAATTSTSATLHLHGSTEAARRSSARSTAARSRRCTSPQAYTGLADGAHTFHVRAIDAAGNTDATPATRTWTVDTTAPDTTIDYRPDRADATRPRRRFTFTSTETGVRSSAALDGGAFAVVHVAAGATPASPTARTPSSVRAIDAAGNVDATPASQTWTIDTTRARHDDHREPDRRRPTSTTPDASRFTGTETGATFECRSTAPPSPSARRRRRTPALADGPHTFQVRAVDAAGNADATPASRTLDVDTTPPDTTITGGPNAARRRRRARASRSRRPRPAHLRVPLDGGAYAACTSPQAYTGLADGAHTFHVRAIDAAGNVDATPATAHLDGRHDGAEHDDLRRPDRRRPPRPAPTFTFTSTETGAPSSARSTPAPTPPARRRRPTRRSRSARTRSASARSTPRATSTRPRRPRPGRSRPTAPP